MFSRGRQTRRDTILARRVAERPRSRPSQRISSMLSSPRPVPWTFGVWQTVSAAAMPCTRRVRHRAPGATVARHRGKQTAKEGAKEGTKLPRTYHALFKNIVV